MTLASGRYISILSFYYIVFKSINPSLAGNLIIALVFVVYYAHISFTSMVINVLLSMLTKKRTLCNKSHMDIFK